MRLGIWGDRSSIGADQCKSFVIFIQISLTPGQVATDVCQALEYSTWKAHVHINQRIPTPVSKELLSEDILRMAHTVHSVPLSIFRAQGPPDSLLSSCDPPFWCHGFLCHGDIQIQFCNICRNHTSFSVPFNLAEVTSVSRFSLIMETKIHIDWITFTQLINIWYKKNLQGNWTICIIQVPFTPIYNVKISHMRGQIKPKFRSKWKYIQIQLS